MLVLSRRTGEGAVIAERIHVVVLSVRGNRVKLGFEGPLDVSIHREEVQQRILEERSSSAKAHRRTRATQRKA
jgi:carbon storage regulator